jgi:hypothetical protein
MRLLSTAIISSFLALAGLNAIDSGSLGANADYEGHEASGSGSGSGSNRGQRRCRGGAYISAISTDSTDQTITSDDGFVPIIFDGANQSVKNILHPVGTDLSQFQVLRSGFYLINWSVDFAFQNIDDLDAADVASLQLFNVTTGVGFAVPQTIAVFSIDPGANGIPEGTPDASVAGSIIVFLPRGTVVSLSAASANGTTDAPLNVDVATFTMVLLSK